MSESIAAPPPPSWWHRHGWLLIGVGAVLALVASGISAVVLLTGSDDDKAPLVDPQVLIVARQEATNFFDLDYTKADASVNRVLALATGKFKSDYTTSKPQLLAKLTAGKVVCTATIPEQGAAVEFVHSDQAQVLVVVNVPASASCGLFNPSNRTRVVLNRVDGHWLVSGLNQVG